MPNPLERERPVSSLSPVFERRVLLPSERLQVKERIKGERLPLFFIRKSERNERIARMWQIPGTSVKVSPEGDIHYPVWRERSHVNDPSLYTFLSKPPRGWTVERLLKSKRRPISEVVFNQVKKDKGAVETAIRAMDHVLEKFQEKGKELQQVESLESQIALVVEVLESTENVSREEFDQHFGELYRQTTDLLVKSGMPRAQLALKRDVERLIEEASVGRDKLGRKNPLVMMRKLQAAARRISYRRNEAGFVVDKFEAMKAGLLAQRRKDREILGRCQYDLAAGFAHHEVFKFPGRKVSRMQKGILLGLMGTLAYRLDQTRVKPYKPVAVEATAKLRKARLLTGQENYQEASEIFGEILGLVNHALAVT